jgi:hypothetical protein
LYIYAITGDNLKNGRVLPIQGLLFYNDQSCWRTKASLPETNLHIVYANNDSFPFLFCFLFSSFSLCVCSRATHALTLQTSSSFGLHRIQISKSTFSSTSISGGSGSGEIASDNNLRFVWANKKLYSYIFNRVFTPELYWIR